MASLPRKLCILLPSLGTGGAEKVGVNLANHYASLGVEVDLVTILSVGRYRSLVSKKVNLIDLNARRARYSILSLRSYLKAAKPDLVLSVIRRTNIFLGLACYSLASHPPLYFREASPLRGIEAEHPLRRMAMLLFMRISYRKAARVIANSRQTHEDLIRYGITGPARILVVDNPVLPQDLDTLMGREGPHPWFEDPSLKVVLSVGRLYPEKDQATLIRAFALVAASEPAARLLVLGEGPEKANLEALIAGLGLGDKVMLHDFVDNPFPYYRQAALCVLTSLYEGFGNVIVEALSAGTPIVSTDCPGGPRFILEDGKLGRLAPPGDARAVGEAILAGLRNPPDREALIRRARDFTVARAGERYAEVMGFGPG